MNASMECRSFHKTIRRKSLVILILASLVLPSTVVGVLAATVYGTGGNDTLYGTAEDDVIYGYAGDDKIYGREGNDQLFGNSGNDYIEDTGNDPSVQNTISGNGGDDTIRVVGNIDPATGGDMETIDGQSGNDNISLENPSGDDIVRGGAGDDTIDAKVGNVVQVYGGIGNDKITIGDHPNEAYVYGGPGSDTISCTATYCPAYGGDGNDKIDMYGGSDCCGGVSAYGGAGNDYLVEHTGINGYLNGGYGDDTLVAQGTVTGGCCGTEMWGGPGADSFTCSTVTYDDIRDYNPQQGDQIQNRESCEKVNG